ncbi:DUF1579 family protein [Planctomicrobium piriforme]|uniref:DUF1579 domain-containing protein n=1 Tax=Planctomicrobium piriforme TaxID=1576369 RepID=A0A1I3PXL4_9PLAN|nr:DUF1579 family protein [Planctomicrobium piriforme]SFJ26180.1 Protein of unknown function [Planctomicrobium piriforme]
MSLRFVVLTCLLTFFPVWLYADNPSPGDIIKRNAGVWSGTLKTFAPGNPEPVKTGRATERTRPLGDGIWVVSEFDIEIDGERIVGTGQFGFDQIQRRYVGSLVDSKSPSLLVFSGDYVPETNATSMVSQSVSAQGGAPLRWKLETRHTAPDKKTVTMFLETEPDRYEKIMETEYTRQ